MNSVIEESLGLQSIASAAQLKSGVTFEQLVHERFEPYIGLTADEIAQRLGLRIKRGAKNFYSVLTNRILGIGDDKTAAEFAKAGITLRTMRLKPSGMPKEAVSFRAFNYIDLVQQEWEDSDLRLNLTSRFIFVVYQLDRDEVPTLLRTQFWTMPIADVDGPAKRCFEQTVQLVMEDKAEYLPKASENKVCHVRPHGRDASDKLQTPSGRWVVRKSFWLNQRYLADQLASGEDS